MESLSTEAQTVDQGAPTEGRPPATAAELDALRADLAGANAKAAEYLDGWQRSRAEFANYKRRQENELGQIRVMATSELVKRLLPVLDDFDRASRTMPDSLRHMTWIEGVMLIHRKLQLVLDGEGVKPIDVKPNDAFDPLLHEAISHDESAEIAGGNVIEEVQKGYRQGDRVLRPALVRVAR